MKEDTSNMIQRNAPRRYSRDGMQQYTSGIRDFLKSAVGHLVIWSFGHRLQRSRLVMQNVEFQITDNLISGWSKTSNVG